MGDIYQTTLKSKVSYSGYGLFTGKPVEITLNPAQADTGLVFIRTDLPNRPSIPYSVENFTYKFRRTMVSRDGVEVEMIEHLAAALYGMGVDNVIIEINNVEVPVGDGSAQLFVDLIKKGGVEKLSTPKKIIRLTEPVYVVDGKSILIGLPHADGLSISYTLEYDHIVPSICQHLSVNVSEKVFEKEIAPAQTFCFKSEVETFLSSGLGKGATKDNVIVIDDQNWQNNGFKLPNELVRHKILDLIGDLSVLGHNVCAKIIAIRSGHKTNFLFIKEVSKKIKKDSETSVESVTKNFKSGKTLLNISEILKILPHRYPFLLIDKIIEVDDIKKKAIAIKNVSVNEPYFQGHFPGRPVMPGVLQIEAMAQLAGFMLLQESEKQDRFPLLLAIDDVKLRRLVEPGDQLIVEAEIIKVKSRYGITKGKCSVNGETVAEAIIKFAFVKSDATW